MAWGSARKVEYKGYPYNFLDGILDPRVAFVRAGMENLAQPGAVLEDPNYQPVNEERHDHTWPAAREDIIRSDLTSFEMTNGGAVFSVGSMCFIGALPIDNYTSAVARLVTNVVRRFADPKPFLAPQTALDV